LSEVYVVIEIPCYRQEVAYERHGEWTWLTSRIRVCGPGEANGSYGCGYDDEDRTRNADHTATVTDPTARMADFRRIRKTVCYFA
jgi:hypothetical protein